MVVEGGGGRTEVEEVERLVKGGVEVIIEGMANLFGRHLKRPTYMLFCNSWMLSIRNKWSSSEFMSLKLAIHISSAQVSILRNILNVLAKPAF